MSRRDKRAVRDGFDALAALGDEVEITRHGRYIRAERRANASLDRQVGDE